MKPTIIANIPNMVVVSTSQKLPQQDQTEEYIRSLNEEKSYLQLIITLMNKICPQSGIVSVIDTILQGVLNVIGGTNLILVYQLDSTLHYVDLYGVRKTLDHFDDIMMSTTFTTGMPQERTLDFSSSLMTTEEFGNAYSWAYPLQIGGRVIGVLKIENLHISMAAMSPHLPPLFNYIAATLNNEIFEESRLKKMLNKLEFEVAQRRKSEQELLQIKENLEEMVNERSEKLLKMEQQFQQTQKLESLGILAGGIAHDFNNILTIINGHCFMLLEQSGIEEEQKYHIEQIDKSAARAALLCRQMLDYAGKNPINCQHFSMTMLTGEIIKMVFSAITSNISLQSSLPNDLLMVTGDIGQIQQVVMNLLINASEAIDENSKGSISVTLKCKTLPEQSETDFFGVIIQPGEYACLEVADTGSGMDDEVLNRIFEPFYTTKFTGRGLGMAAVSGIIKKHNGAIQIRTKKGEGTTFILYLPIISTSYSSQTVPEKKALLEPIAKTNLSVLLVDDEEPVCKISSALLASFGCQVLIAENGQVAVSQFLKHRDSIDCILLDLVMPVMGGIEAYHELRKLDAAIPVVFCTGYASESVTNIIAQDRNCLMLQKPFSPISLSKILNSMIKLGYSTNE